MKLKIGTRGSKLALTQAQMLADAISSLNPSKGLDIISIKTLGDQKQGTTGAGVSDKKEWVYELELALLNNKIDLAIHSGKDVPNNIEKGTLISSILKRANPFDAFIGKKLPNGKRLKFSELEEGSFIGTASLRREASLLIHNKNLK